LCTTRIAETVSAAHGGLMHGPTFMGNPLACAVAVASVELLLSRDWAGEVAAIEAGLKTGLAAAQDNPRVVDVRVLGAIGVVELDHAIDMVAATRAAVEAGVWLRPFRNLVYTMPPFISSADDIARIAAGVVATAAAG
jgi:adenosylmethionine-8-amino-7-oxononanoate aminotransferase